MWWLASSWTPCQEIYQKVHLLLTTACLLVQWMSEITWTSCCWSTTQIYVPGVVRQYISVDVTHADTQNIYRFCVIPKPNATPSHTARHRHCSYGAMVRGVHWNTKVLLSLLGLAVLAIYRINLKTWPKRHHIKLLSKSNWKKQHITVGMCDQVETVVLLLHEKSLDDTALVVSVVYISVHAKKPCNCNSSTVKCVRMIGLEISLCQCNRTVFPWASRKWIQRNQAIRTPNSPEPIDILTTSWRHPDKAVTTILGGACFLLEQE